MQPARRGTEELSWDFSFLEKKKKSLQTTTRLKVSYPFSCAEIPNSEACWLEGSTDNFFFFFLNPKNSETQRFSSPVPMENC